MKKSKNLSLDQNTIDLIEELAESEMRTYAAVVTRAVQKYAEERE